MAKNRHRDIGQHVALLEQRKGNVIKGFCKKNSSSYLKVKLLKDKYNGLNRMIK